MNVSLTSSDGLEVLVQRILDNTGTVYPLDFLTNESMLFEILSNLSSKGISQTSLKLSFCVVFLLISEWKKSSSNKDLLPVFYNFFKVTGKYIYFTYANLPKEQDLEVYPDSLIEQYGNSNHLLLFVPDKFIKDKRLYRITYDDITRISQSKSWHKLPDPHNCQSWIKLPSRYQSMKINELMNKKFSKEIISGVDPSEESIAKRLIFRNNYYTRKITIHSDTPKSTFYKLTVNCERGGPKSVELESPAACSEDDLEPASNRLVDLNRKKQTQISQSTKTTENMSPGFLKEKAEFLEFKNNKNPSSSQSTNEAEHIYIDTKPTGKLKRYTLNLGDRKLFPT